MPYSTPSPQYLNISLQGEGLELRAPRPTTEAAAVYSWQQDAREKAHGEDAAASSDVRCASGVGRSSVVRSVNSSRQLRALRTSLAQLRALRASVAQLRALRASVAQLRALPRGRFAPPLDSLGRFAPVPTL